MKFCFQISRRLAAYSEGEVSPNDSARIKAHLDGCARCRERSMQIHQRIELMRQLPLLDPADQLWTAIARDVSTSGRPAPVKEAFTGDALSGLRRRFGHRWLLRSAAVSALREFPAAPGFTEARWPEARTAVAFPVIAPEILPGGYKLAAARLYSLGGLRALQFKYRSEQDAMCVFQLPSGSKLSFGEKPSEQYHADGVFCWRARARHCAFYCFVLGETQCALMTCQTDPAVVDVIIQAFKAEAGLSRAGSAAN